MHYAVCGESTDNLFIEHFTSCYWRLLVVLSFHPKELPAARVERVFSLSPIQPEGNIMGDPPVADGRNLFYPIQS